VPLVGRSLVGGSALGTYSGRVARSGHPRGLARSRALQQLTRAVDNWGAGGLSVTRDGASVRAVPSRVHGVAPALRRASGYRTYVLVASRSQTPLDDLWLTCRVKKLADYGRDDHSDDDGERAPLAWAVAAMDDCDGCGDIRVELTLEQVDKPGTGLVAHLAPDSARALRAALALALREMGEAAD